MLCDMPVSIELVLFYNGYSTSVVVQRLIPNSPWRVDFAFSFMLLLHCLETIVFVVAIVHLPMPATIPRLRLTASRLLLPYSTFFLKIIVSVSSLQR